MSTPFIGEIRMFAGAFAPSGWAFCDGQLINVADNEALFSLLGTIYGGNGTMNFALPDLRGRLPVHAGSGPGLPPRTIGAKGGSETVTVTVGQLPAHTHQLKGSTQAASTRSPGGNVTGEATKRFYRNTADQVMASQALTSKGGNQPHTNVMPFLCVNFIIALFGIFPSQN